MKYDRGFRRVILILSIICALWGGIEWWNVFKKNHSRLMYYENKCQNVMAFWESDMDKIKVIECLLSKGYIQFTTEDKNKKEITIYTKDIFPKYGYFESQRWNSLHSKYEYEVSIHPEYRVCYQRELFAYIDQCAAEGIEHLQGKIKEYESGQCTLANVGRGFGISGGYFVTVWLLYFFLRWLTLGFVDDKPKHPPFSL